MPIWRVSPSLISSVAMSVQITSAAATTSSDRGGIGGSRSSAVWCSTRYATSDMWRKFSPYVRISRSSTSQTICLEMSQTVRLAQSAGPKLR